MWFDFILWFLTFRMYSFISICYIDALRFCLCFRTFVWLHCRFRPLSGYATYFPARTLLLCDALFFNSNMSFTMVSLLNRCCALIQLLQFILKCLFSCFAYSFRCSVRLLTMSVSLSSRQRSLARPIYTYIIIIIIIIIIISSLTMKIQEMKMSEKI